MTKSPTSAPKAMQADGVLDDAALNTKTPDPSGPATAPDQQGADNPAADDAAAADAEAQAEAAAEAAAAQATADAEAAEAAAAQATADAEAAAAAEAQAKADAEAAAAEAPALDLGALRYCEQQITLLNVTGHRLGLLDQLRDHYGAVIATDDDLGLVTVTLQGITIDPADSVHTGLDNWGNAARRAIAAAAA